MARTFWYTGVVNEAGEIDPKVVSCRHCRSLVGLPGGCAAPEMCPNCKRTDYVVNKHDLAAIYRQLDGEEPVHVDEVDAFDPMTRSAVEGGDDRDDPTLQFATMSELFEEFSLRTRGAVIVFEAEEKNARGPGGVTTQYMRSATRTHAAGMIDWAAYAVRNADGG